MTQKIVTKLIILGILVSMLQACNNELDSLDENLTTNNQNSENILEEIDYRKYNNVYYLPSSKGNQAEKFQKIVNGMKSNDALVVSGGVHYIEQSIVLKTGGVTIIGQPGNVIRLQPGYQTTLVYLAKEADSITIRNINIDGTGGREYDGISSDSCMVVFSNSNNIENCTFRNAGDGGLLFGGSDGNTITGCQFSNNHRVGLSQWNSAYNEIKNCQIYSNGGEGITVDSNSHWSNIHNNIIKYNSIPRRGLGGIGIDASNDVSIYNNAIFENNYDGIKVQNNLCGGVLRLSIYNNRIFGHNVGGAFGLRINNQPVTFGNTSGNVVYNNARGTVSYDNDRNAPCTWGDEGKPQVYHNYR